MQPLETRGDTALDVLWHMFARYRLHVIALVVLGLIGATLDGIGINSVIPLLSFLGNGGAPTDPISLAVARAFGFLHIPFTFRYLLAFIVGLFMVRAVASVVFGYMRGWIMGDFLCDKSESMLRKTFLSSWSFLLQQKLGHVQNTLVRDIQNSAGLLESLSQGIQSFTGLIIYTAVAITISPVMTLSTFLAGALLVFLVRPVVRRIQESGTAMAFTEKQMGHFLGEHILGMKIVKASGAERKSLAHSKLLLRHMRSLHMRLALMRSLSGSVFQPFSILFIIVLFAISYRSGDFNLVVFGTTLYLIYKIFTYLDSGQNALNAINALVPYARSVSEFERKLDHHREESVKGAEPFAFEDRIEFVHVALRYQDDVSALADVSLSLKKGQTAGLIGPSGAGKTSIADLLLRLFQPSSGEILVDGKPLSDISMAEWREHIGYVSQDVFVQNDTIEENIRFYRDDLGREDIETAAKQANIYDFIMSLRDGFQTTVGDRGVMLSGGQRQRIVLARALARKPSILILDEATSALDRESENLIHQAIENLRRKITVIIIAHRLSTVMKADRIFVLEKGKVAESGKPDELMNDPLSYLHKNYHA